MDSLIEQEQQDLLLSTLAKKIEEEQNRGSSGEQALGWVILCDQTFTSCDAAIVVSHLHLMSTSLVTMQQAHAHLMPPDHDCSHPSWCLD